MEEWMCALKGVSSVQDLIKKTAQSDGTEDRTDGTWKGQHSWSSTFHGRPTYCNVCREALSGVTFHGLSCEVCKFKAHKRCSVKSPNTCKWLTLQTVGSEVLEDEYGNPSMPHQWVEGNLPVGSKCWACDKTCGSVLRLQDWRCLWCRATLHSACKPIFCLRCPMGLCRVSVIAPVLLEASPHEIGKARWWQGVEAAGCSPLLVFVNSKSGDNQGEKFLRRFRQLLNPAQVFDLMAPGKGPVPGLMLFSSFQAFRILVCGGDGSVSWVLSEIDRLKLHKQCQIGVLPLGTGNDLARVLGWGAVCDDDSQLPQLLEKYERATTKLLDRWSILTYEGPLPMPRKLSQSQPSNLELDERESTDGTENWLQSLTLAEKSVQDSISEISESEEPSAVSASARKLSETVRNFVLRMQSRTECQELKTYCSALEEKLANLLESLTDEDSMPDPESATDETQNNNNNNTEAMPRREVSLCRARSLTKALRRILERARKSSSEESDLTNHMEDTQAQLNRETSSYSRRRSGSSVKGCSPETSTTMSRPDSLPILQTTPESPPSNTSGSESLSDEERNANQKQLSSPTASRRISSGSTLKHFGNFGLQLAVTPSFAGACTIGSLTTGDLRSPDEMDRRIFPIINPLASLPAWPNLAGESSLVGKALLANADALCAAASPLMDIDEINLECFREKCVMNNYFGIGLDAKIALEFHNKREEHPEKCRSRTKNLMWYGVLGGRELLNKTFKNLEQKVQLECDGHRIALPSLQGIVVLNIPSYGGGSNFWGGSKEDDVFFAPAMDDKILEVVAVFGTVQMAASRVMNLQHHRIAQCRSVRIMITGSEGVPVQVDGEAWLQPPGCVFIQHKNRTQILCRNRQLESSLKSWNEKQRRPSSGNQSVTRAVNTSAAAPAPTREQVPLTIPSNNILEDSALSDDETKQLSSFLDAASQMVLV